MFGIGVGELFVIFVIAVVVIGPNKLPEVARTIGRVFATVKRTTNSLRDQMQEEVKKFQEMDEVREFKASLESEMYQVKEATETYLTKEIEAEEKRLDEEVNGISHSIEHSLNAEGGPGEDLTATDTPAELDAYALPSGAIPFSPTGNAQISDEIVAPAAPSVTASMEPSAELAASEAATAPAASEPEPRGPLTAAEVAAAHGAHIYAPPGEAVHGSNGGSNGSTPGSVTDTAKSVSVSPDKPVS